MPKGLVYIPLILLACILGCGHINGTIGESNSSTSSGGRVNTPPTIVNIIFIGNNRGNAPADFTFIAQVQDPDEPSNNLQYLWDFADGTTSNEKSPVHHYTYRNPYPDGGFNYKLTVYDSEGASDTMEAVNVPAGKVYLDSGNNRPYVTVCTVDRVIANKNEYISFSGDGADDDVPETLSYRWDFGDGTTFADRDVFHKYAQDGLYTARFTVTDQWGASSWRTIQLGIGDDVHLPPVITHFSWTPLSATAPGATINFTCSATDAGGVIVSYRWIFDNRNRSSPDQNPTFVYQYGGPGGIFTVRLTVENNYGLSATTENIIHIGGTTE